MPQAPPPISYANLVALFTTQLTVSIHTILAAREIYPANTFIKARAYNYPIMQSRHQGVCDWINDAVKAVHVELLKGTVARVVLVIFEAFREDGTDGSNDDDNAVASGNNGRVDSSAVHFGAEIDEMNFDSSNSMKRNRPIADDDNDDPDRGSRPLERYLWDVSRWPAMPKSDLNTPFSHAARTTPEGEDEEHDAGEASNTAARERSREQIKARFDQTMKLAHQDLHEQFRGLLARLSTISARMAPLASPQSCTFTLCLELKEEGEPPIGHPQPWIPAEKPLQRTILHPKDGEEEPVGQREKEGGRVMERGRALGGVRTTPVRTVDSGEMIFEMWIEEGKAKFEGKRTQAPAKTTMGESGK